MTTCQNFRSKILRIPRFHMFRRLKPVNPSFEPWGSICRKLEGLEISSVRHELFDRVVGGDVGGLLILYEEIEQLDRLDWTHYSVFGLLPGLASNRGYLSEAIDGRRVFGCWCARNEICSVSDIISFVTSPSTTLQYHSILDPQPYPYQEIGPSLRCHASPFLQFDPRAELDRL